MKPGGSPAAETRRQDPMSNLQGGVAQAGPMAVAPEATGKAYAARLWDGYGMLLVFAVLFVACSLFVPNFFTTINMRGLALAVSLAGMVACGMLFCLAAGDFDLSVASVVA